MVCIWFASILSVSFSRQVVKSSNMLMIRMIDTTTLLCDTPFRCPSVCPFVCPFNPKVETERYMNACVNVCACWFVAWRVVSIEAPSTRPSSQQLEVTHWTLEDREYTRLPVLLLLLLLYHSTRNIEMVNPS